ncbi:MAG: twin-arginine translocase TatA/TatE family subunit [Deltaproteobacteria bacterium]|nr:twin-arginine translocase TatA/TatE family subunit [Deltaproteobacteria bacterium]
MGRFNWTEILLLLAVALLLFGAKRLPEIAKSFGRSIQEFKKGFSAAPDEKDDKKPDAPNGKHPDPH